MSREAGFLEQLEMPAVTEVFDANASQGVIPVAIIAGEGGFQDLHSVCAREERLLDVFYASRVIAEHYRGYVRKEPFLAIGITAYEKLALVYDWMRALIQIIFLLYPCHAPRHLFECGCKRNPLPAKRGFAVLVGLIHFDRPSA